MNLTVDDVKRCLVYKEIQIMASVSKYHVSSFVFIQVHELVASVTIVVVLAGVPLM